MNGNATAEVRVRRDGSGSCLDGFGESGFVTAVGVKTGKNQNFFKKIWRKEIFAYFCSVLAN